MKDDYLWNRTGSDPEIEKLENVLMTLRAADTSAAEFAQTTLAVDRKTAKQKSRRRFLSFGIASFACLALAIFGIVSFTLLGTEVARIEPVANPVQPAANVETELTPRREASPIENIKVEKTKIPAYTSVSRSPKRIRIRNNTGRSVGTRIQNGPTGNPNRAKGQKDQEVILTKEEKYAYDQLMLGLSITSSNLKIVKDKANGISDGAMPKKISK